MIAAKDIEDEDSLRQWLAEWPKSKNMDEDAAAKVAISITHRIALRGFPLVWKWFSGKEANEHDLSALPFLRCLLISGVSSQCSLPEIKKIAFSVAGDAMHFAYLAIEGAAASCGSRDFDRAFYMAFTAASAAEAAIDPINQACYAVSDIRYGLVANDAGTIWKQIQLDGMMFEAGEDVMTLALWHDTAPRWFDEAMTSVRQNIQMDQSAWDFWMSWWEGSIKGELLPEALLTEIAIVPDDFWDTEAQIFANVLEQIVMRFENGEAPLAFTEAKIASQLQPNSWFWQIPNKIFKKLRNLFIS